VVFFAASLIPEDGLCLASRLKTDRANGAACENQGLHHGKTEDADHILFSPPTRNFRQLPKPLAMDWGNDDGVAINAQVLGMEDLPQMLVAARP
jgi:hypothetical protein